MHFVDLAQASRGKKSLQYLEDALALESEAARACDLDFEPTRSILYRSAASLALKCEKLQEAEKLIAGGLLGNPPDEIADELRDLLENVYFRRHLKLKGIKLDDSELQMSLWGRHAGHGIIASKEFIGRVQVMEKLVHRTAERIAGYPFRDNHLSANSSPDKIPIFLSVPRAASFATTIRLGVPDRQLVLDGFEEVSPSRVVEDVLQSLETLNSEGESKLKVRISDDSYRRNFIGLARRLAPDGAEVRSVGLTFFKNRKLREVVLSTKRSEMLVEAGAKNASDTILVRGHLLFADGLGKKESLKLRLLSGETRTVQVPRGMLADLVKPLFGSEVEIEGTQKGAKIILKEIHEAPQPASK